VPKISLLKLKSALQKKKSDKAETSTLLQNLISMKYQGRGNAREYIIGMSNIASKLRALKLELSEDLLIHSLVSLRSLITVRRGNGLLMSSFHTVCKKRKD